MKQHCYYSFFISYVFGSIVYIQGSIWSNHNSLQLKPCCKFSFPKREIRRYCCLISTVQCIGFINEVQINVGRIRWLYTSGLLTHETCTSSWPAPRFFPTIWSLSSFYWFVFGHSSQSTELDLFSCHAHISLDNKWMNATYSGYELAWKPHYKAEKSRTCRSRMSIYDTPFFVLSSLLQTANSTFECESVCLLKF